MQDSGEFAEEARPNDTVCALVLGGAPIVRAGITYMLKREYSGRAHVFSADWQGRDQALAGCGKRLDLIVLYSDGEATRDACLGLADSVKGAGALIVVPPTGSEARLAVQQDGVVSIPLGAPLPIWRKALQVAAKRRSRLRSPPAIAIEQAAAPLTERQHEVLEMLSMGLSNKTIASRLSLSVGTVKLHVAAVLRGLQARNRLELVLRRAAVQAAVGAPRSPGSASAAAPSRRAPESAGSYAA
jgi:DNA-binding CsgD family transcriptional regulator